MFTVDFWKATAERAVRTFAQSLAAVLMAGATNLFDVEWRAALATAGLASLLAVLTALGAGGLGRRGPGLTETTDRAVSPAPPPSQTPAKAPGT